MVTSPGKDSGIVYWVVGGGNVVWAFKDQRSLEGGMTELKQAG